MTLTADELAMNRLDTEKTLPSVCNVVIAARSRNPRGETIEVYITGEDFACAVDPFELAPESEQAQRIGANRGWYITCPLDIVVAENDRIGFTVEGESRLTEIVGATSPESEASLRTLIVTDTR